MSASFFAEAEKPKEDEGPEHVDPSANLESAGIQWLPNDGWECVDAIESPMRRIPAPSVDRSLREVGPEEICRDRDSEHNISECKGHEAEVTIGV